ncbi:hypothetical protein [Pararcticibacter amylolyticus]|uniref:Uncharacterized protein n=1 Tax=Pararcticibacter amylolyticus TaxID=2173175 RepID=A0A2U2PAA7_9SPHI|nr:hypothetical protein [Pararcticibacter amylolyticus]PWG78059.1 hypothetical protein DDR33_24275 [Pararcticibacter amylolyticus]
MIYLVDDNKNDMRASQFGVFFVEQGTYSSVLKPVTALPRLADLSFLKGAACILIHKTMEDCDQEGNYIQNSHENVNNIIEVIADYGSNIPLVIFSNRIKETEYDPNENPDCVFQINKTLFYSRLDEFIKLYQRKKKIEFRLLTEGIGYQTAEADRLANKILDSLIRFPSDKAFRADMIDLEIFESFYTYTGIPDSGSSFINELEQSGTSVKEFKDNITLINESLSLYGKNIYNWKK